MRPAQPERLTTGASRQPSGPAHRASPDLDLHFGERDRGAFVFVGICAALPFLLVFAFWLIITFVSNAPEVTAAGF